MTLWQSPAGNQYDLPTNDQTQAIKYMARVEALDTSGVLDATEAPENLASTELPPQWDESVVDPAPRATVPAAGLPSMDNSVLTFAPRVDMSQRPRSDNPILDFSGGVINDLAKILNLVPRPIPTLVKAATDTGEGLFTLPTDIAGLAQIPGAENMSKGISDYLPEVKTNSTADDIGADVIRYGTAALGGGRLAVDMAKRAAPALAPELAALGGATLADGVVANPTKDKSLGTVLGKGPTNIQEGDSRGAERLKIMSEAPAVATAIKALTSAVVKPVTATVSGTKKFANLVKGASTEKGMRERAGEILRSNATDPKKVVSTIEENAKTAPTSATAAEISGDPNLIKLQDVAAKTPEGSSGGEAGEVIRNIQNKRAAEAISDVDSVAKTGEVTDAVTVARKRVEDFKEGTQKTVDNAQAKVSKEVNDLGDDISGIDAGNKIQKEVDAKLTGFKKTREDETKGLRKALFKSDKEANVAGLVTRLKNKIANAKDNDVKAALSDIVDKFNRGDGKGLETSAEQLFKVRQAINKQISGKSSDDSARFAKSELVAAKRSLDVIMKDTFPEFTPYISKFKQLSKPINELEGSVPGGQIKKEKFGKEFKMKPEDAARAYIKNSDGAGAETAIKDFIKQAGDRPKALQALQDRLVTVLRERPGMIKDGVLDPKKFDSFIKSKKASFNEFPELQGRLMSVFNASEELADAAGKRLTAIEKVEKEALGRVAKDGEKGIKSILAIPNAAEKGRQMSQLITTLEKKDKSGRALNGLKKFVKDELLNGSNTAKVNGEPALDFKKYDAIFQANKGVYRKLYGDDGLTLLTKVRDGLEFSAKTGSDVRGLKIKTGLGDNLEVVKTMGAMIGTRVSKIFGGTVSPLIMAARGASFAKRLINGMGKDQVEFILAESFKDPKLMKALITEATDANEKVLVKRLKEAMAEMPKSTPQTRLTNNAGNLQEDED